VQAGDGIVARLGNAVIVADASSGLAAFTNVVLADLDSTTMSGHDAAWRIAELLVQNRAIAPSFGAVIATQDGYQVLLHGNVRAVIDGGTELLGAGALTWVDRPVHEPVSHIALTLSASGEVQTDPRTDLRGGSVPGNGFVLSSLAAAPAPAWTPPPTPEPVAVPPAEPSQVPFTPQAASDQTVGLPDTASFRPVSETVTSVGAMTSLVAEDGSRLPLDRSYVFGREPHQDPMVIQGDASPIRLDDAEQLISRVQAYLHVDEHGVTIKDATSANGTFVAAPGAPDWTRLGEGPVLLPVGWSLRMGRRVFSHYGAGQ